jgi:pyruvate dehydrogenase E2 component (dihydrolipoamide acetyltransferase)
MTDLTMPRLSDSMEEGTILKWLIASGDKVTQGQELVEIETDKATIVYVAEADGTLAIIAAEGTTLPVGALIARIGVDTAPANIPPSTRGTATPGSEPRAASNGQARELPPSANERSTSAGASSASLSVLTTPLARRIARVHEIRLDVVEGSGPRGRITRADVLKAAGIEDRQPAHALARAPTAPRAFGAVKEATSSPTASPLDGAKGTPQRQEATRLQQLVARRMAEAKATIPHFQVQTDTAMDAAIALRAELKASANGAPVPSFNDFIVRACAIALREHPRANASYTDGGFNLFPRVNIGVAVAAEDALVVPVVMDADSKSLGTIARETRRLAERVRSGEISPPELSGGTFTVSNLGMYGMTAITPVVNPPQTAILGVGALRETLVRVDGEIVDRTSMTLTLSCDHRILYGADAARLLADIRTLLETPLRLAL